MLHKRTYTPEQLEGFKQRKEEYKANVSALVQKLIPLFTPEELDKIRNSKSAWYVHKVVDPKKGPERVLDRESTFEEKLMIAAIGKRLTTPTE